MKENWIVPCNLKYFDIDKHLSEHDEIVFKKLKSINVGDSAYIYVSGENGQIKYKGTVLNVNCDDSVMERHSYAKAVNSYGQPYKYFLIKIEQRFPNGLLMFKELKENGLGQVQVQARTSRKLQFYLDQKEESIKLHDGIFD